MNSPLDYAFRLLKRRIYSKSEMKRKLLSKGFSNQEIDSVLRHLEEDGLIDDVNYAECFVRDRINTRPMGRKRLRLELKYRGIDEKIIDRVLNDLLPYDEEVALCEKLTLEKIQKYKDLSVKDVSKIKDFLLRRGFDLEVVLGVLKKFGLFSYK